MPLSQWLGKASAACGSASQETCLRVGTEGALSRSRAVPSMPRVIGSTLTDVCGIQMPYACFLYAFVFVQGLFCCERKGCIMTNIPADGEYTIAVTLNGGSGKATVVSPAPLSVKDGHMQAVIEWSSSHYDYMAVSGSDYYPINTEGHSRFLIDLPALDREIPVQAETLAMSSPHTIDYTLYFDSSTLRSAEKGHAGTVMTVVLAGIILLAGGALAWKRRRNRGKSGVSA